MNDGQADNAPATLDDLASFIGDNPESIEAPDDEDELNTDEPQEDNSEDEESPADEDDEEDDSDDDSEKPEKQTSGQKHKVTVKGEDGADQEVEVPTSELIAGYQRHADYTRKAMELGEREKSAVQMVSQKLDEGRRHFETQAQMALAAVNQLAGIPTPEQMAYLAENHPAEYVKETERVRRIQSTFGQIQANITQSQQQAMEHQAQAVKQAQAQALKILQSEGVKVEDLRTTSEGLRKHYGFKPEELESLTDVRVIRALRDATLYRELKAKKPETKAAPKQAPNTRVPAQRQPVPSSKTKALDQKFKSGRASERDLGAFILQMRNS